MAVCHQFEDRPVAWVFVLAAEATCAEAEALGRVLGREGFPGRFVSGDLAETWRTVYILNARRTRPAGEGAADGER